MKQPLLTTLASIFISISAFGQTLDWMQTIHTPETNSQGFSEHKIAANDFDELLVIGPRADIGNLSFSFGTLFYELFDADGNEVLSGEFEGKARIIDVVAHGEHFYIAGAFMDSLILPGMNPLTIDASLQVESFVFKMHRNGEVQWVWNAETEIPELDVHTMDMDGNGHVFIAAGRFTGESVILILDDSGMVIDTWEQDHAGHIASISVNDAGEVALAGSCARDDVDFNGTVVVPQFDLYNQYVVRYDAEGNYQWSHFMEDITCPEPEVLLQDDGTTYFAADVNIEFELDGNELAPLGWVYSFFCAKIDEAGEVVWTYQPSESIESLGDAQKAIGRPLASWNGGVIIGGLTRGSLEWGQGVSTDAGVPGQSFFMGHIQEGGIAQNVVISEQNSYSQQVYSVTAGPNGSLYMLGAAYDSLYVQGQTLPNDGMQLFISKWDEGIVQDTKEIADFGLTHFPDPAQESFRIGGALPKDVLTIYDLLGRPVKSLVLNENALLEVNDLTSGTYVLRVMRGELPVYQSSMRLFR